MYLYRCHDGGKYVWGGKLCEMKGEVLPISSEYIIGLSLGVVVALVVTLVCIVADTYFGCRRRLSVLLHRQVTIFCHCLFAW